MKTYLISLAAGVLIGVIYGLLNVRSPAPPYVALLGLLGILLGEQSVQAVKHRMELVRSQAVISSDKGQRP